MDPESVLQSLRSLADKNTFDGMLRYGIPQTNALGVSMANMQRVAKEIGVDHALALGLWKTGCYEARSVAALIDDPAKVTSAQMDAWCRNFDSWAICDTVCFKLFDRVPHAFAKIDKWARSDAQFVKRGAFALLACVALHDKKAPAVEFAKRLPLIEKAATDERNFVMKGVSWALRAIGRRGPALHAECIDLSQRLAASDNKAARWIGKDALRDLKKVKK